MTPDEISKLSTDELLDVMRREKLEVTHSLFSTIHFESDDRPDGFSNSDLDQISDDLEDADLRRWRRELTEHFAGKG